MLRDILTAWKGKRILVVGDGMIDVYHFGKVRKLSAEAPVPIFEPESVEYRPGGAGNVFRQIEALGCSAQASFLNKTRKIRYMAGTHLLLRVDEDVEEVPSWELAQWTARRIQTEGIDAVILSDYDKGWCSYEMCDAVISTAQVKDIPVVVDPKRPNWDKFAGATVVCPNEHEWKEHQEYGLTRPVFPYIVEKRSSQGIRLHYARAERGHQDFPAQAKHVYDVTGAGDTVVAVVAATLAARGTIEEACRLANLAAGYVVGEVGTATCSRDTLLGLVIGQEEANGDAD